MLFIIYFLIYDNWTLYYLILIDILSFKKNFFLVETKTKTKTKKKQIWNALQHQLLFCIERDKFKEDSLRLKIANEEREKHSKNFEEQFKLLGQYGEVDSNFTKILNVLKLRDDNTSWMKMDPHECRQVSSVETAAEMIMAVNRPMIPTGSSSDKPAGTRIWLWI